MKKPCGSTSRREGSMKRGDIIAVKGHPSLTYVISEVTGNAPWVWAWRFRDGRIAPGEPPFKVDLMDFEMVGQWDWALGYEEKGS
jgi:hypothetical protein